MSRDNSVCRIYVAGPYTLGDCEKNIEQAIKAGEALARLGCIPFIPHLTHFWHQRFYHTYAWWLEYGREWLQLCHGVFRLPGASRGADQEEKWAKECGKPVFYQLEEVEKWLAEFLAKSKAH